MEANVVYKSPVGNLLLKATNEGLFQVAFTDDAAAAASTDHAVLVQAMQELDQYFGGERTSFSVPVLLQGTAFQRKVWSLLMHIPFGTTTTYQSLSKSYGDLKAIRAVAAANGSNKLAVIIPCHRVIGSDGGLTGYAWGLERKRWLLHHEAQTAGVLQPQLQLF